MGAGEREDGCRVVKCRRRPGRGGVTQSTVLSEGTLVFIVLLVTGKASGGRAF